MTEKFLAIGFFYAASLALACLWGWASGFEEAKKLGDSREEYLLKALRGEQSDHAG